MPPQNSLLQRNHGFSSRKKYKLPTSHPCAREVQASHKSHLRQVRNKTQDPNFMQVKIRCAARHPAYQILKHPVLTAPHRPLNDHPSQKMNRRPSCPDHLSHTDAPAPDQRLMATAVPIEERSLALRAPRLLQHASLPWKLLHVAVPPAFLPLPVLPMD